MRTTTLQSSKASSSLWKLFAALLLVWILVPIGQASAQNKATESNGTEKTVIGGVGDLYGVDPSSEHCTDTRLEQIKPMEIRLYVCIMSVPKSF